MNVMMACRNTTRGYKAERKGRDFVIVVLRAHVCDAAPKTWWNKTLRAWTRAALGLSADAWLERLEKIGDENIRAKVASIVWWDFWAGGLPCQDGKRILEAGLWMNFRAELDRDEVCRALCFMGYPERLARERTILEGVYHCREWYQARCEAGETGAGDEISGAHEERVECSTIGEVGMGEW